MDIKMPDVDGIKLTHMIMKKQPSCDVIMLTLYDEYLTQAMEAGAKGYLLKDIKREELSEAIRQVHNGKIVISRSIKPDNRRNYGQKDINHLELSNTTFEETIQALASMAEMRDPYLAGHQRRVAQLAISIATEMELSEDQISGLRMASLVHDIGKARVPVEILTSSITLSLAEFTIIKMHPAAGYEILKTIDFPQPVAQIVYQHHERLDGSGYPNGISGDDIILEAKILAVADVVDAMSSHRPYRPAVGLDKALLEISENKGILYDSKVVESCLEICGGENFKFA
jgi:putative two-component system response regulator